MLILEKQIGYLLDMPLHWQSMHRKLKYTMNVRRVQIIWPRKHFFAIIVDLFDVFSSKNLEWRSVKYVILSRPYAISTIRSPDERKGGKWYSMQNKTCKEQPIQANFSKLRSCQELYFKSSYSSQWTVRTDSSAIDFFARSSVLDSKRWASG